MGRLHLPVPRTSWFSCVLVLFFVLPSLGPSVVAQPRPAPSHGPTTRSEQSVPFAVGETLVYDVSWSSYVTAGQATLRVNERTPAAGATSYHIVADGRPTDLVSRLFTLYYKVETWLDAFNLLPRRAASYNEEGRRKRQWAVTFDQAAHRASYQSRPSAPPRRVSIPPLTQDPLSTLYVVRALRLGPGQQLSVPVMNGEDLYRVALTTGPRETVLCGLGSVQAMRVDIKMTDAKRQPVGRNAAVWLTTGRRQVPVRMKADLPVGSFGLILREARGLAPDAPHGRM